MQMMNAFAIWTFTQWLEVFKCSQWGTWQYKTLLKATYFQQTTGVVNALKPFHADTTWPQYPQYMIQMEPAPTHKQSKEYCEKKKQKKNTQDGVVSVSEEF